MAVSLLSKIIILANMALAKFFQSSTQQDGDGRGSFKDFEDGHLPLKVLFQRSEIFGQGKVLQFVLFFFTKVKLGT